MKKLYILLSVLLALSLAACGSTPTQPEEPFEWTREGYFADENEANLLSIYPSEDAEHPGWMVGFMSDTDMHGWYIQLEGKTLHGDITAPYEEGDPFVVTISEEGTDGVVMKVENGGEYHFMPYEIPEAAFAVSVNTDGFGQIAYAQGEEQPVFDDEYPNQSAYIGLAGPEVYTFAAKPDEGYRFRKWTIGGREYSKEAQITLEITEDTDLVAVFGVEGTNDDYVDLSAVTTLGELLDKPECGKGWSEKQCVFAFEQEDMIYRAVAEMTPDAAEALFALEWEDEEYAEKERELLSPLKIVSIENLTESIPQQEELDQLIGKTGAELLDDGWYCSGWNLDEMIFFMDRAPYEYDIVMSGEIPSPDDFDDEDIRPLVIESVRFARICDAAYLDEE